MEVLFILLFVLISLLFPLTTIFLLSFFSGWNRLAKSYAVTQAPEGEIFKWVYLEFGRIRFNGLIKVIISEKGFYVSARILRFLNYKDLLLP